MGEGCCGPALVPPDCTGVLPAGGAPAPACAWLAGAVPAGAGGRGHADAALRREKAVIAPAIAAAIAAEPEALILHLPAEGGELALALLGGLRSAGIGALGGTRTQALPLLAGALGRLRRRDPWRQGQRNRRGAAGKASKPHV